MNPWTYAPLIGAALILGVLYLRQRQRSLSIQKLATRSGFAYLGTGIPRSLTLGGTPVERASSIWNVIDGDRNGVRIVAFDCQIGTGKASWRRTVIAVQSDNDRPDIVASSRDLEADRSGKWIVMYEPKKPSLVPAGLMPVDELEARLNAITR